MYSKATSLNIPFISENTDYILEDSDMCDKFICRSETKVKAGVEKTFFYMILIPIRNVFMIPDVVPINYPFFFLF